MTPGVSEVLLIELSICRPSNASHRHSSGKPIFDDLMLVLFGAVARRRDLPVFFVGEDAFGWSVVQYVTRQVHASVL